MAKLHMTVKGATLDVEGDEAAVTNASRMFHRALAEQALKDIEERIAGLRPLMAQRRKLKQFISTLVDQPPALDAVARHDEVH